MADQQSFAFGARAARGAPRRGVRNQVRGRPRNVRKTRAGQAKGRSRRKAKPSASRKAPRRKARPRAQSPRNKPASPKGAQGPRPTASDLARKQRDISVSEFFAKNRHLLGFDNPSKALLTTVKEGVDNSLDACEESGILPDVKVEISQISETRFCIAIEGLFTGAYDEAGRFHRENRVSPEIQLKRRRDPCQDGRIGGCLRLNAAQ